MKIKNKLKRQRRIRLKLKAVSGRPRLSIFRSNKKIYAQIIDDKKGKTLASASEKDLSKIRYRTVPDKIRHKTVPDKIKKGATKAEVSQEIGKILAQKAKKAKINKIYFDRGKYKYHGRVKALAKGAREGGLVF